MLREAIRVGVERRRDLRGRALVRRVLEAGRVDRGVDHHAGPVEDRSVQDVGVRHAGGLEPPAPVAPAVEMQQGQPQEVALPIVGVR